MRWFRSTVEGAGLSRFGAPAVFTAMVLVSLVFGWLTGSLFKVVALGFFVGLGAMAFELEALAALAKSRRRNLNRLWPEVIDSIYSAVAAGLSLADAIDDLALRGPLRIRDSFLRFSTRLDNGWNFNQAIDEIKAEFGEAHADRLCEVLRLTSDLGSESLARTLKRQSQNLREELAALGQIEAKQGWVLGTAKIAIAAPWLVVAILSLRSENAQVYNTLPGISILLLGFIVSIFAYRLVQQLGGLPTLPRVFQ